MVQIVDGNIIRNELTKNAMGGTELLAHQLINHVDTNVLKDVQIVSSRVRELEDNKIRIFWAHDLPDDPESHFLKDKNNQNKFHKFVFVSNWQMQGYINQYNIPYSKCIVLQNAINPIDLQYEKPKDKINLIYYSTPHRGLELLVPVVNILSKKYNNIHLDVYSSFKLYGWEQRDEPYKQLFDYIDNHSHMTNHSSVSNAEIRKALQYSHIFAYPSIWLETSCLCLMEAMSAGLICVHSNYGALYETAANWTMMYQMQEDPQQHMSYLYGTLEAAIGKINDEAYKSNLMSTKSYADIFYSWKLRAREWQSLINSLKAQYEDRSIPKELFTYKTN